MEQCDPRQPARFTLDNNTYNEDIHVRQDWLQKEPDLKTQQIQLQRSRELEFINNREDSRPIDIGPQHFLDQREMREIYQNGQRGIIPTPDENAGKQPEIWFSTNPKDADPLGQGEYLGYYGGSQEFSSYFTDPKLGYKGNAAYLVVSTLYAAANIVYIIIENFIYAFSGVPRNLKTIETYNRFNRGDNPHLRAYAAAIHKAILHDVPLSVSSGFWRKYLDHQHTLLIQGLVSDGYPERIARNLVNRLLHGENVAIFRTYTLYKEYWENRRLYGNKRITVARPTYTPTTATARKLEKVARHTRRTNRPNRRRRQGAGE